MSRRIELLGAALWAAVGAVILVASWRMDRLTDRGINPWSAPGLTPGLVGALMVLLALVLAVKTLRRQPMQPPAQEGERVSWSSAAAALLLCLLFAGVSLGRGLPFMAEAALFIWVFISVFSWKTWREQGRFGRALVQAAVVALAAAGSLSWLFESVFLVRLP